ncbi:MAG: M23 family metallopeptidase, partial [Actinomycetota bacterium]|nr:M23 family metallopeptidase [Actinomycetota bacterium]
AQFQRESDQIAAILAARVAAAAADTPASVAPVGGGQLLWPAAGPLTSGYGYRTHPIFGDERLHTGIDIGASYGAQVIAADAGAVVFAGAMSGYGNAIVIDHGGGLATTYNHLSAFSVGSGQEVGRGAPIGAVGCSGYCTGPHLHFEVRIDGSPVDPMPYLQ